MSEDNWAAFTKLSEKDYAIKNQIVAVFEEKDIFSYKNDLVIKMIYQRFRTYTPKVTFLKLLT